MRTLAAVVLAGLAAAASAVRAEEARPGNAPPPVVPQNSAGSGDAGAASAVLAPGDLIAEIRALRIAGSLEDASAKAAALVQGFPRDVLAHITRQDVLRDLGRDPALEAEYRTRARAEGATADDLFLHARLLRGAKAVAQYRAALKLDPRHFRALCGLGSELLGVRDLRGAEQAFNTAAEIDAKHAAPMNGLARVAEAKGDAGGAELLYRRAIEASPGTIVARVNLGILLTSLGRTKEARVILEQAAKTDPSDPTPVVAIGMSCLHDDSPDDAVAAFERALKVAPRSVASLNLLASTYIGLGRFELAESAITRSIAANARSAATWILRGHLHLAQSRPEAAREAADQALSIQDDCGGARHVLALALEMQGEMKKAESELRRAVKCDDTSPVFHRALAQILGRQGKWREALREFEEVAERTGDSPDALYDVALAHIGLNEPKNAISTLQVVVERDPERTQAWFKLGVLLRDKTRDTKGAIAAFKSYLEHGGKDARVRKWIAELESKK